MISDLLLHLIIMWLEGTRAWTKLISRRLCLNTLCIKLIPCCTSPADLQIQFSCKSTRTWVAKNKENKERDQFRKAWSKVSNIFPVLMKPRRVAFRFSPSSFVCHSSPLPVNSNPSPNFVFFSLFVPYLIYLIPNPTKFLYIGEPSGFDSI